MKYLFNSVLDTYQKLEYAQIVSFDRMKTINCTFLFHTLKCLQDAELSRKAITNRYAEMEAKFSCERCDKRFRRKNDLTMHIANVHLKVDIFGL